MKHPYSEILIGIADGKTIQWQNQGGVWTYRVNNTHTLYSEVPVPDDAYDTGTLVPLYAAPPQAQPAKPLTKEEVRAVGGIVHSDGNIFFTNIEQLNAAIKEQP